MPNTQKVERVAALKERIEGSNALLLAEYRGLSVAEIGELRRSLRETDTSFAVIKNTLMARAAADAGIEELEAFLTGPSAVAFVAGDPVAAAKAIKAAAKQYPALVLKGAYMDGAVLDEAGATRLAELESREVMLSKIAGLAKNEMSRAAAVFVAAQSRFLSLLEAFREKVPGDGSDAVEGSTVEEPPASDAGEAAEAGEDAQAQTDEEAPSADDAGTESAGSSDRTETPEGEETPESTEASETTESTEEE